MSDSVKNILERLPQAYRKRIERRARDTARTEEDVIVEMLKREDWLERFRAINRKLAPLAKDTTEEEIFSLPRMPAKKG